MRIMISYECAISWHMWHMSRFVNDVHIVTFVGVGVPHGDGPRAPPRCLEGVRKKFQMTNFTMPNNVSSMKYALKSVPGLADFRAYFIDET